MIGPQLLPGEKPISTLLTNLDWGWVCNSVVWTQWAPALHNTEIWGKRAPHFIYGDKWRYWSWKCPFLMVSEKFMPSHSCLGAPFDPRHKMLPCITLHINQDGAACIILPLPTWVSRLHVPSQLCDKPGLKQSLCPWGWLTSFVPPLQLCCLCQYITGGISVLQEHNTVLTITLQTYLSL